MSEELHKFILYHFTQLTEVPERRYRKGSIYDPILDDFINSGFKLVKLEVEMKFHDYANYIRTQLSKRIVSRNLNIKVRVVNGSVYLERKVN